MIAPLRTTIWMGVGVAAVLAVTIGIILGFDLSSSSRSVATLFAGVSVACWLRAGSADSRLIPLLECVLLFALICGLGAILSYFVMYSTHGFVDARLDGWDRTFGFRSQPIREAVEASPWLHRVLAVGYGFCATMPLIVLAALHVARQDEIMYRFVGAYGLALGITLLIFCFLPARAAVAFYLPDGAELPLHAQHYSGIITGLRDGSLRTIDLADLDGIITFPSFHAAMAVLFGWATWSVRYARWPIALINALMWVSAVPIGAHYVVDIFGGTIVAAFSIVVVDLACSAAGARRPAGQGAGLAGAKVLAFD